MLWLYVYLMHTITVYLLASKFQVEIDGQNTQAIDYSVNTPPSSSESCLQVASQPTLQDFFFTSIKQLTSLDKFLKEFIKGKNTCTYVRTI